MKMRGKYSIWLTHEIKAKRSPQGSINGCSLISLVLATLISINVFSVGQAQETALTKETFTRLPTICVSYNLGKDFLKVSL